jgi:PAS domain S-box-containing protein
MTENLHKSYRDLENEIDERKRAEAKVLKAKEEWERTFASVPDMIAILDNQHRVIRVNEAMAQRLGRKPEECIGLLCYEAVHGTSEPPDFCLHVRTLRDGKEHIEEVHEEHLGGDFLISTTPLYDDNMQMIGSVHVAHDITARKRAEDQLKEAYKELEGFSYTVAHDLRAPLRHLMSFAELLQKRLADQLDERTRHYTEVISAEAKRMGMLIDDLLAFTRMKHEQKQVNRVNLNTLLKEVIRDMKDELTGRDIAWELNELPEVCGDQSMLKLVLVNLISNAVKFTLTRSGAEIKVECKEDEDDIVCSIRDNGAGFDMKYVDKLFGVFQRLHHQREFEGTGIGLAIVRRIITQHGGRTWAEGAIGQGSIFYFTLPRIKET